MVAAKAAPGKKFCQELSQRQMYCTIQFVLQKNTPGGKTAGANFCKG
jgi:hypothetical protein